MQGSNFLETDFTMEAFSNKAEEVIQRSIDVKEGEKCEDVHSYLEIDRCISFVTQNDFKRVALQFPDNLLWTAAQVVAFLSKSTSAKYFILGDTSYGSCCVDEVAANHAEVDCIIHFGRSCLSRTSRLPVLYVFGKQPVDVEDLVEAFKGFFSELSQPVLILYDVIYAHIKDELKERLSSLSDQVIVSMINISVSHPARDHKVTGDGINNAIDENHLKVPTEKTVSETEEPRTHEISGRYFTLPEDQSIDNCSCFYIGGESLTLKNLMMTLNKCMFYSYYPETKNSRRESLNVNRMLMKRYYLIERAKDADIVGILVGTLGVSKYLDILNHLKNVIKRAGKKHYTFAVGKLNVAKLANFMEVQVYVLVACQENTLIDSTEFYQPVVTPFEMEIACNQAREWTGEYVTDFSQLLPGAAKHIPMPDTLERETDVSLITGSLRSIRPWDDVGLEDNNRAVVKREEALALVEHKTAGESLSQRSWQGLQPDLGQTPVSDVIEGTRGIAASYTHEEGTPV